MFIVIHNNHTQKKFTHKFYYHVLILIELYLIILIILVILDHSLVSV